jgi:hypothetical protein
MYRKKHGRAKEDLHGNKETFDQLSADFLITGN